MTFVLSSDNSPKALDLVRRCRSDLNSVNVAALNYSRADDHPGMFANLTKEEMLQVRRDKLDTAFEILVQATKALQPEYVLPYAGDYGVRSERQDVPQFLGLCPPDEAIEYLKGALPAVDVLYPSHGVRWSFDQVGKLQKTESIAHTLVAASPVPSAAWYEGDQVPRTVIRKLEALLNKATPKLLKRLPDGKYDSFVVQPRGLDVCFHIDLRNGMIEQRGALEEAKGNFVRADLNLNYLIHLLTGFCDWTSAQSGLHTDWYRKNDVYDGAFYSGLFDFKA